MSHVRTTLARSLFVFLVASAAEAQEHGESNEEHFHRNEVSLVLANTYESSEGVNLFTFGAEYARLFTERFGVIGEFEALPERDAWVFVVPFVFKVAGEFEVFAGIGVEHVARRPRFEGGEGEHHEGGENEVGEETGADNLFLVRMGAGYHIRLGERFFMTPHVALDFVDEERETATAIVYGVVIGFGF